MSIETGQTSCGISDTQIDLAARRTRKHVTERGDGLTQAYRPRILRLAPRKGQQLSRERFTARSGSEDRFQRTNILLIGHPAHERLRLSAHDHQQIIEVMCDAAGQLTKRLHFLRLRELFMCPFERFLRIALFRDVARDLGEADELRRLVADRVDDDVGPEQGSVLAHAPGFRFEAAGCGRDRQGAVW